MTNPPPTTPPHIPRLNPPTLDYRLKLEIWGSEITYYHLWSDPQSRKPLTRIYLRTPTPALVSYVLGYDWRPRSQNNTHLYNEERNWTEDDEVALRMRILRAGGAVVDLEGINLQEEDDCEEMRRYMYHEERGGYVFAWPETGGVWVLELTPPLTPKCKVEDMEEAVECLEREEELVGRMRRGGVGGEEARVLLEGRLDLRMLWGAETVGEYCGEVERLGGRFFADPGLSGEVVRLRLLDIDSLCKPAEWV